jgi:hypothetical protein
MTLNANRACVRRRIIAGLTKLALGVVFATCGVASQGRAEILGYTANTVGKDTVLTSVVVNRDQRTVAYDASKLIRVTVTHFKSPDTRNVIYTAGLEPPQPATRVALLGDLKLNTGLINPGGQSTSPTRGPVLEEPNASPGMAVTFESPVINLPGDDVVVFEIQRGDSPAQGDAFHVGPLHFAQGLRAIMVHAFDVTSDHPAALPATRYTPYVFPRAVGSLQELRSQPLKRAVSPGGFKALAVGVDLSDLGYPEDATVDGLFFQDAGNPGVRVDPVLIAGLPRPEPPNILSEVPKLPRHEPQRLPQEFLKGPMANVEEIVFAERVPGDDHWYANFGHYWCGRQEYPEQRLPEGWQPDPIFKRGGRLCRLNVRTGQLKVLLDDPDGGVRDPQVHYNGSKILFSYRRGGQSHYHLHEIQSDGTGLVQLTDGPYDDIEPTYLPDGGIVFCSSRCRRVVNCWRTPVATLYRCDADGTGIRPVSSNIEHDNTPWVLPDGRVLYMRWEYVDRNQLAFHHLWTTNPDGTGQMVFYGNQYPGTATLDAEPTSVPGKHPGIAMLDAKPIPGTDKVVASFSPRHGRPEHMGVVTIVDPKNGPDDIHAARPVSQPGQWFRDPYAFSEDCFLVASRQGISVMDGQGNTEAVYRPPAGSRLECHEPRPLFARRRERVIPSRVDLSRDTGRLVLSDIYHGRNMEDVRRGEIKKLLVLEQLPKPVNFSGGPWPLSIGGTFTLARVLGTVPVEPDGSAYFEVPALRPVFFVALDKNDLSVKRMQSFVSVEPGETTGCVGCHEHRARPPRRQLDLMAFSRAPSRIESIATVPDVLDFPRDIQPILNRHCVECHNPDRYDGQVDLTGDHTPLFSQSYWTIVQRALIADGRNEPHGNRAARTIGTGASRLLSFLDGSHYEAKLSDREYATVRLWIETSATYPGTYAALGSGMTTVAFPVAVIERRCGDCHGSPPNTKPQIGDGVYFTFGKPGPPLPLVYELMDLKRIRGTMGYFKFGRNRTPLSLCNLTRPDKSLLVRAPLLRTAGGLELCEPTVFADPSDPDYCQILASITTAADRHRQTKRFDMPGFRPNDHYILQMQRYGILAKDLAPEEPIDAYAADRAYWRSFWYRSPAPGPANHSHPFLPRKSNFQHPTSNIQRPRN